MTRELLNKIAKAKKIDLTQYDSVLAWVNENYTKVYVSVGLALVTGGNKTVCCQKDIVLSVSAILKREEEWPEDYVTKGWQYFDYLK